MVLVFLSDWSPFPPRRWKLWAALRMFTFFQCRHRITLLSKRVLEVESQLLRMEQRVGFARLHNAMASFGQNIKKVSKLWRIWRKWGGDLSDRKTKTSFEISRNLKPTPGCPMQSIDLEHYLRLWHGKIKCKQQATPIKGGHTLE